MPDTLAIASILAKLLIYVGTLGAVGLVIIQLMFTELVAPLRQTLRVQTVVLAGLALLASALGFMLGGAALTGDMAGMTDMTMLGLLWQTQPGEALQMRTGGMLLVILGITLPRHGNWVSLIGGLAALWSFAQIGHVPSIEGTGAKALLLAHLVTLAFWIGVLSPLRTLCRSPEHLPGAAELGHRFGQIAAVVVPALALAGLLLAWMLLGTPRAVITTGYGQALLFKLVLIAAILRLAARHKLRLVPALQDGNTQAARLLARSIEIETALFLVVLTTTATLTSVLTLPM
jgi:putative copper resistance protein D